MTSASTARIEPQSQDIGSICGEQIQCLLITADAILQILVFDRHFMISSAITQQISDLKAT